MRTRLLKWSCCCSPFISLTNQRASTAKSLPKAQRTRELSAVAKVTAQTSQEQANSEFWPNEERCLNCEKLSSSCCIAATNIGSNSNSNNANKFCVVIFNSQSLSIKPQQHWVSHWQDHAMIGLRSPMKMPISWFFVPCLKPRIRHCVQSLCKNCSSILKAESVTL